jgi:hypothetical protein
VCGNLYAYEENVAVHADLHVICHECAIGIAAYLQKEAGNGQKAILQTAAATRARIDARDGRGATDRRLDKLRATIDELEKRLP